VQKLAQPSTVNKVENFINSVFETQNQHLVDSSIKTNRKKESHKSMDSLDLDCTSK
jgi:hypothetical protein